MKILFLGPDESSLLAWLRTQEDSVAQTAEPIDLAKLAELDPDFLVSFGYRHIIKPDVIARYEGRAVNLHISLLPWNRGADPNFWSIVDETPRGVSIHYLDAGVDTGDIIAQREIAFSDSETLRTSYSLLTRSIEELFFEVWPLVRVGTCPRSPQNGAGSAHRSRDKEHLAKLLTEGWDTTVGSLVTNRRAQRAHEP